MKHLLTVAIVTAFLLGGTACTSPEPLPELPESATLFSIDPIQFTLERSGTSYEFVASCTGEGAFAEINLNVQTTNTQNNTTYQVGETGVGETCVNASDIVFSNALFTSGELVPGESFEICVTVTIDSIATTDCLPVTVREDGLIALDTSS